VAVEAERVSRELLAAYPKALVVAGQVIFEHDTSWNRLLHNETAFATERRLQHAGVPMSANDAASPRLAKPAK
jgi:hypothetical protein